MSADEQALTYKMELSALEMLDWFIEAGADEATESSPINWFEISAKAVKSAPSQTPKHNIRPAAALAQPMISAAEIIKQANTVSKKSVTLEGLEKNLKNFVGCTLKNTAANTVFADGNKSSQIMIIGEAPTSEEDRTGRPFLGQSGELLEKMLHAIGLERSNDYYLTNILPWRPPGNRKPTETEISICMPFVKRHIELFAPKMIILLGSLPLRNLIHQDHGVLKSHGKWYDYNLEDKKVPLMAIFHPNYLIQQPAAKKAAWKDLQEIKTKIEEIS